jgi:hypothetical protein
MAAKVLAITRPRSADRPILAFRVGRRKDLVLPVSPVYEKRIEIDKPAGEGPVLGRPNQRIREPKSTACQQRLLQAISPLEKAGIAVHEVVDRDRLRLFLPQPKHLIVVVLDESFDLSSEAHAIKIVDPIVTVGCGAERLQ